MRIIDADALYKAFEEVYSESNSSLRDAAWWFFGKLEDEPTIAPPPNDPLTLEELREMDGEPVWISYLNSAKGKYHIVRALGKNSIVFEEYDKEFGPYKSLFLGNYGKNWLAYHRKPESLKT